MDGAGACNITFKNTGLTVGSDTITVAYSGNANYNTGSDATQSVNVVQNSVTGTLTTSPAGTAALGQAVTLTATFIPNLSGQGTPTGTVTFTDTTSSVTLGTGILAGGVATLTTSAITPGANKTITASWPGDTSFTASAPTALLTISEGTTVVTLTPSPTAVPLGNGAGSTVTFNYSVQGGPANVSADRQCADPGQRRWHLQRHRYLRPDGQRLQRRHGQHLHR